MNERPALERLFSPRSIAVIGASADLDKLTGRTVKALLDFGYEGRVYPVNPKYDAVGGLPALKDAAEIPEGTDVAVLSIPARLIPETLEKCGRRKIPFAVVYSSGFAETGDTSLQEEIVSVARRERIRVLGPNCQGFANFAENIPVTFSGALYNAPKPKTGNVAFVSQSGAFGFSSFGVGLDHGVRYRYVVTTGNQCDLDAVECAEHLILDPEVRLLMMYIEGLRDGEAFLNLVKNARERDVAVAILKAGRSPSAKEAAKSHTAALTGDERVWKAVFDQYGVIPMEDIDDIIGIGQLFGSEKRRFEGRTAILTTSGGAGIVMADSLNDQGLSVPEFAPRTKEIVAASIPAFGASRNPVDMTVQISETPEDFQKVLSGVLNDPDIDGVVTSLSMIVGNAGNVMTNETRKSFGSSSKPQAVVWMIDRLHGGEFIDSLKETGVPVFQSFRQCARGLKALKRWGDFLAPERAATDGFSPALDRWKAPLTEYDAKQLLAAYGIPTTKEFLCRDMEEVFDAADTLGFPVAVKGMASSIMHKTEAGVVALDIRNYEELRHAVKKVRSNIASLVSPEEMQGFLVSEMVKGGFECIVGVKRDPVFGPVVAVGLGGIYVEVLGDVSLRHAPIKEDEALRMIRELKGYPFLSGARGRKPRDITALAKVVSRVSVLAEVEKNLAELDINPVFVMEEGKGVVAADALVVRKEKVSSLERDH